MKLRILHSTEFSKSSGKALSTRTETESNIMKTDLPAGS